MAELNTHIRNKQIGDAEVDEHKIVSSIWASNPGLVGGSGTKIQLKLDGSTLVKGASGVKVGDDAIGATQVDETDTYDFSGGTVSVATPSSDAHAATKSYVDSVAEGLSAKDSARVGTVAALPACTYDNGAAGVGATLTGNANGALAVQDGVTLVADDRLLVQDQVAALQNGIYKVTTVGDGGTAFVLTRVVDNDEANEQAGAYVFVEEGTVNADNGFVNTTDTPVTMGTTAIAWTQFSGAGQITAGTGLSKSGNEIRVGDGSTGDVNGINRAADQISVAVDGTTVELSANKVQVKDGGISEAKLGCSNAPVTNYVMTWNGTLLTWANKASDVIEGDIKFEDESANCNGSTVAFTLASNGLKTSLHVVLNGLTQQEGAGKDYTFTDGATTVTFATAPLTGDILLMYYVVKS